MIYLNQEQKIRDEQKNKEPKIKAYLFKVGTIKKGKDNRYWKVAVNIKGSKEWIRTTRKETLCQNYLKLSIKKNLLKYKKGEYKSSKQAVAIAYSITKRKYPKCKLVTNSRIKKTLKNNSITSNINTTSKK